MDNVAPMTTHWNDKLNEVASSTRDYLHTAKAAWPFPHEKPLPRPDVLEIARTTRRDAAFPAPPEILPDYSHCGINE